MNTNPKRTPITTQKKFVPKSLEHRKDDELIIIPNDYVNSVYIKHKESGSKEQIFDTTIHKTTLEYLYTSPSSLKDALYRAYKSEFDELFRSLDLLYNITPESILKQNNSGVYLYPLIEDCEKDIQCLVYHIAYLASYIFIKNITSHGCTPNLKNITIAQSRYGVTIKTVIHRDDCAFGMLYRNRLLIINPVYQKCIQDANRYKNAS